MEYFNNQLCITHAELTSEVMTIDAVNWYRRKGQLKQVQLGGNGREALFVVDSLPFKYKAEVYRRNPDMKAQAASKSFVESIEPDGAALNFFETYSLGQDKYLAKDKVEEYANNAAILNAFRERLERSNSERTKGSHKLINKSEFWKKASNALPRISDKIPNSLPVYYLRLQEKFNQYIREGYAALITSKYGMRNAAKVDNDHKESVLLTLMAKPNNLDNTRIAWLYNVMAQQMGWEEIGAAAVGVWKNKYDLVTSGGRLGETRFRNQKTMQVKRSRPTLPLLYWTLDGWVAELLYQKTEVCKGRSLTTYSHRLTVVMVLDPCLNYPIGYAIGEKENHELIKAALRDAANHTAELFGRRYRVNQMQTDNYGRGAVKPTYKAMGENYTPARAKNAKAKVIEPYFGYFNKKYCQMSKNWSGYGITSNKNSQPNSEYINKHRHSFPTEEECREQLASFVERERAEKRERYLELFAGLSEQHKLPLSDEQYLLTFGAETGFKNAIEGAGLRPTIGGIKRDYDCFNPKFREYAHIRWSVKYDPQNLDNVLAVNEDGSLRFMLERKHVQPMALAERKEGDAEQLERVFGFNKTLEGGITQRLALADSSVEQLFHDNPQLDVATRLMICDSRGQNKDHKRTQRLQAHQIEDIEAIEITTVKRTAPVIEDEDILNLY